MNPQNPNLIFIWKSMLVWVCNREIHICSLLYVCKQLCMDYKLLFRLSPTSATGRLPINGGCDSGGGGGGVCDAPLA
jgi:hypothetical protein